jgi:hypothetical protein
MSLGQPFEIEVVKNVAIDYQLIATLNRPDQEFFQQLRLADIAAQVQVTDHDAIVMWFVRGLRVDHGRHHRSAPRLAGHPHRS